MAIDTTTYDDFESGSLSLWEPLSTPLPDGSVWEYTDDAARTNVSDGVAEISIPAFTSSHDHVLGFDNAKHLLLSKDSFALPETGVARFSVEMAAQRHGDTQPDYRDGFLTFNVLNMETLLIFDLLTTGERTYAIYERLEVPGVLEPPEAFNYIVDAPQARVSVSPGVFNEYAIELDIGNQTARWFVDDVVVFETHRFPVDLASVRLGMGIMTLKPFENGRSVSAHGQGMTGRWRRFQCRI